MPLSMPSCTSHGPSSWQMVLMTMSTNANSEPAPVRTQQRTEQVAAPAAQHAREPAARLVDVFGGDAPPRVDAFVAGEVERTVAGRRRGSRRVRSSCDRPGLRPTRRTPGLRPPGSGSRRSAAPTRGGRGAMPVATMRPPSINAARSASAIVDGRCTTTSAVRSARIGRSACFDARFGVHVECGQRVVEHEHAWPADDGARHAPVAGAVRRKATAPVRRSGCRDPTGGRTRTSPARPRARPRCRPRSRRGARCSRFSRTLAENSVGSSNANPTWPRRLRSERSRTSCPSSGTRPAVGS